MTFTDLLTAGFRNSICLLQTLLHPFIQKMKRHSWPRTFLAHIKFLQPPRSPLLPPHTPTPHSALAGGYLLILLESLQGAIWSCFLLLANKLFTCRMRSAEYKLGYSLPGIMQSGGHGGEGKKECGVIKSPSRAFLLLTAIKMLFFYWLTSCWVETFNYHFHRVAVMRSPPSEAVIEPGVLLRLTLLNSHFFFLSWWIGAIALIARPSGAYDQSRGQRNALFIYSCCQSGAADWMLLLTVHEGLFNKVKILSLQDFFIFFLVQYLADPS